MNAIDVHLSVYEAVHGSLECGVARLHVTRAAGSAKEQHLMLDTFLLLQFQYTSLYDGRATVVMAVASPLEDDFLIPSQIFYRMQRL